MKKLIIACIFLSMIFVLAYAIPTIANAQYYGNCTYHAYKLCAGNSIYWYSGCNQQQDLYYSCVNGQTCQYGQCVNYIAPIQPIQPIQPAYNPYNRTACYNNSVYWYDSLGAVSGLNKSCNDKNSCTLDSCSGSKCSNILKCDGSTCAVSSADYNSYCPQAQPAAANQTNTNSATPANTAITQTNAQNKCGNGLCEPDLSETNANCPSDCKIANQPANSDNSKENQAAAAAISTATVTPGFWAWLKHWYLWILAGLIIIFLFISVYKRFSSQV